MKMVVRRDPAGTKDPPWLGLSLALGSLFFLVAVLTREYRR